MIDLLNNVRHSAWIRIVSTWRREKEIQFWHYMGTISYRERELPLPYAVRSIWEHSDLFGLIAAQCYLSGFLNKLSLKEARALFLPVDDDTTVIRRRRRKMKDTLLASFILLNKMLMMILSFFLLLWLFWASLFMWCLIRSEKEFFPTQDKKKSRSDRDESCAATDSPADPASSISHP